MADKKPAGSEDTATTGHEWDGISELDTPLPRWWLWIFYATIVWGIAYMIAMPSVPGVGGDFSKGLLGYASRSSVDAGVAKLAADRQVYLDRLQNLDLATIEQDPELFAFALAGGKSAFGVNCAPCHGVGAAGAVGYPNLNDDDWLWGGTVADIAETLRVGIRAGHPETRINVMAAYLRDGILTTEQIDDVANYVLQLSGQDHDAAAAQRGQTVFVEQCVACHGEDGKGQMALGAPNLTDGIWLYGGDKATLVQTLSYGRGGVMPAWEGRLSPETIKLLAVYVHSLGGGQ